MITPTAATISNGVQPQTPNQIPIFNWIALDTRSVEQNDQSESVITQSEPVVVHEYTYYQGVQVGSADYGGSATKEFVRQTEMQVLTRTELDAEEQANAITATIGVSLVDPKAEQSTIDAEPEPFLHIIMEDGVPQIQLSKKILRFGELGRISVQSDADGVIFWILGWHPRTHNNAVPIQTILSNPVGVMVRFKPDGLPEVVPVKIDFQI